MSFSISFFARDIHTARSRLQGVYAPAAVKALIELALSSIPAEIPGSGLSGVAQQAAGAESTKSQGNRATPAPRRLAGILVETNGHIDEYGGRSWLNQFRVEPYYD